jgi:chromosome segregation ATPase
MVDMAGNSSRFHSTSTDELLKMALGHELKGLLLNYALAARQRSEIASAKEKAAAVEKNLDIIEKDVAATKEKLEGELKTLKEGCEEEFAKLVKAHEEELAKAKRDRDSAMKTVKVLNESLDAKDQRIKTLAEDNKAALSELASLRQGKEKLVSEKENLEENLGLQFEEGFKYALDQVKVLFPDIDCARLGEVDAMHRIDGDKLVPYAPVETAKESPAKE